MGDTLTIALIANTTSRIPFATGEWRGHFKNVGMYSRRIAYRGTCYISDGKTFCMVCQIFKIFMENFFRVSLIKFFLGYLSNLDNSFDITKKQKTFYLRTIIKVYSVKFFGQNLIFSFKNLKMF